MPGVKEWLKKASNDLKASKKLSDDDETLDCSVFHAHQCAEKTFKAFIVCIQDEVPRTHDLGALVVYCGEVDPVLMTLQDASKSLNPYGLNSRYPNDNFYVDKQIAEMAVVMAEKILITIQRKLAEKRA